MQDPVSDAKTRVEATPPWLPVQPYTAPGMPLTVRQIQEIADTAHAGGYDFNLALKTAVRDGVPWYRRAS